MAPEEARFSGDSLSHLFTPRSDGHLPHQALAPSRHKHGEAIRPLPNPFADLCSTQPPPLRTAHIPQPRVFVQSTWRCDALFAATSCPRIVMRVGARARS
jgi:hypothetical protein